MRGTLQTKAINDEAIKSNYERYKREGNVTLLKQLREANPDLAKQFDTIDQQ